MGIYKNHPAAVISDNPIDMTINAYADALNWLCHGYQKKNIHLKNTHGTNTLKYKILTYAYEDGNEYEEIPETALAAGDTAQIILNNTYAQVKVQVKSSVGGSHATYEVDYIGDPR